MSSLIMTLALVLAGLNAAVGDSRHDPVSTGIAAYETGDYEAALDSFKRAVGASPDSSSLHHWLGKCYGRIAENSYWFKAMSYSKKTLAQFRRAVELDGNNLDALRDLISYHEKAPGFLGGSKKEAKALAARLKALESARNGENEK